MARDERIPPDQKFPPTRYQRGIEARDTIERLLPGEWMIASFAGPVWTGVAWHWFDLNRQSACGEELKIVAAGGDCSHGCQPCSNHVDQFFPEFAKRKMGVIDDA